MAACQPEKHIELSLIGPPQVVASPVARPDLIVIPSVKDH
jgi:hypothetical protein